MEYRHLLVLLSTVSYAVKVFYLFMYITENILLSLYFCDLANTTYSDVTICEPGSVGCFETLCFDVSCPLTSHVVGYDRHVCGFSDATAACAHQDDDSTGELWSFS